MHNTIGDVVKIIGALIVSLVLFGMLFSSKGQNFLWGRIEPVMQNHWEDVTMDNGVERSLILEEEFDRIQNSPRIS